MSGDLTDWLTPQQAAKATKRHVDTIRVALREGELHGHQRGRRGHWHINPAALEAWVRKQDGTTACGCTRLRLARAA